MKSIMTFRMNIPVSVFLILVFAITAPSLPGQTVGRVTGYVRLDDGTGLGGAVVSIDETDRRTVSSKDGNYALENVPSGSVKISIVLAGFNKKTISLIIPAGQTVIADFVLEPAVVAEEVRVTAKLPLLTVAEKVSEVVLTPTQILSLPSLGARDLFRAFQLLPGVSGSNEASSGLYVRGGTPDQNLVLYDGFTIYHVDHLFGYFSAFNMKAVEEARLTKGGFEAKYGGRLSSVMELTGTAANSKKWGAGLGLSLLSADGLVEVPIFGIGSLFIAARHSFQSPLYQKIMDMFKEQPILRGTPRGAGGGQGIFSQFESQPKSYFYDADAKALFHLSAKDDVFLSFYNGRDDLDNGRTMDMPARVIPRRNIELAFTTEISDLTNWGNTGISVNWARRWSDHFRSQIVFATSQYGNDRDRTADLQFTLKNLNTGNSIENSLQTGALETNDLDDRTIRLNNEWRPGENHVLEFGVQATANRTRYNFETQDEAGDTGGPRIPTRLLPRTRLLSRDDRGLQTSGYLQDRMTLFDRLTLTPGIRLSYFDMTKKTYIEPRLSFSLRISEKFRLKGAWGLYNQFVSRVVREDVLIGNREFWALGGTTNVPVSSAEHYILGASYETPDLLVDVEAYDKPLNGLAEFAPRSSTPVPGGDYSQFIQNGTGTAKGVEFLVQKKIGDYTGWISYTLSRVLYDFPALSVEPYPALHDQTHEVKFVNSYDWKKWTFAATWIYATGKPYTPILGVDQVVVGLRLADRPIIGDKNSARLPAYHRLDLAATYKFKLGGHPLVAGVTVFNLYNRKNIWYKEYQLTGGELVESNFYFMGLTVNAFVDFRF